jgi:YegS/Rv2252/BmrU family lipid kinase
MKAKLIVNPVSGTDAAPDLLTAINRQLRDGVGSLDIVITTAEGDATQAAREAVRDGYDHLFVGGGDGTLNEVASTLLETGLPLGVIPGGSGNGLARGLGLPLDVHGAVQVAMLGRPRDIDTGLANGRPFLNLAGVGFDAAVAERFNTRNLRRGLVPYLTSILHEWRTVASQRFRIRLDDEVPVELDADLVVVCNGQQYGHGARVAPAASFDDGLFDVVAVPRISAARILGHGWRLFNGTVAAVPGVFTARGRRVEVSHARPLPIHLDGEVKDAETTRIFEVRPRSLRVMAPM